MHHLLQRAGAFLCALLLLPAAVSAQTASSAIAPAGYAPIQSPCVVQPDKSCSPISTSTPLPSRSVTQAASSTAATGTVISSGVTSTSGTAPTFTGGTAVVPFGPQLGYPVRLVLIPAASTSFTASLGTSVDGCATVNTLTAGGSPVTYSAAVNEYVDVPVTTEANLSYCLTATVTAGSLRYAVRN
jgi:hypothetical protein